MKRNLLVLLLLVLFIGMGKVYAAPTTDINTFTIDVNAETGHAGSSLKLSVNGVFEDEYDYYVKFVNKNDERPEVPNSSLEVEINSNIIDKYKSINYYSSYWKVSISDDWYLLNGYDYAYILRCSTKLYDEDDNPIRFCEMSDNPIHVKRPELTSYGSRFHIYFFEDEKKISVFPYFPSGTGSNRNGNHIINLKIGLINDKNLLYSIYKKESDAMDKLMSYAKENDGKLIQFKDEDGLYMDYDLPLQNGAYYYIYTYYDSNNGLYRDVSDIAIAQAESEMLVNDVTWNFNDENPNPGLPAVTTNKIVENPKTGVQNVLLGSIVFIITLIGIVISQKKLKKIN